MEFYKPDSKEAESIINEIVELTRHNNTTNSILNRQDADDLYKKFYLTAHNYSKNNNEVLFKMHLEILKKDTFLKYNFRSNINAFDKIFELLVNKYFDVILNNVDLSFKGLFDINENSDHVNIESLEEDFGLSINNPIRVNGIASSYSYLDRLLTFDGKKIKHKRIGAKISPITSDPVDEYEIYLEDKKISTIYISAYSRETSAVAPKNFLLSNK